MIDTKNRNIAGIVESQFPAHFREAESELIPLIKAYYEWIDQHFGVLLHDIVKQSISCTSDMEFHEYFHKVFLPNFPKDTVVDPRLLVKFAKEFYGKRGTEDAFKYLFATVYGEPVAITYPKYDLFRTSDASWHQYRYVAVELYGTEIPDLESKRILGAVTEANAVVFQQIDAFIASGKVYVKLALNTVFGSFQNGESVGVVGQPPIGIVVGQIFDYNITSGGVGYYKGQFLQIGGDSGYGAIAIVDAVNSVGSILSIQIHDGGVGYNDGGNYFITSISAIAGSAIAGYAVSGTGVAVGGGGANIQFLVGSTVVGIGKFLDDSCQTSSTKRLQDGDEYQEYSYRLSSPISVGEYGGVLNKLLHPSGMSAHLVYDSSMEGIIAVENDSEIVSSDVEIS